MGRHQIRKMALITWDFSITVKIPQVMKILLNKSAEGISIWGVLMELFAVTAATAYCFVQEFPFRYCCLSGFPLSRAYDRDSIPCPPERTLPPIMFRYLRASRAGHLCEAGDVSFESSPRDTSKEIARVSMWCQLSCLCQVEDQNRRFSAFWAALSIALGPKEGEVFGEVKIRSPKKNKTALYANINDSFNRCFMGCFRR